MICRLKFSPIKFNSLILRQKAPELKIIIPGEFRLFFKVLLTLKFSFGLSVFRTFGLKK